MKKKINLHLVSSLILCLISILFICLTLKLNVLPLKYLILLFGVIIVFTGVLFLFINKKSKIALILGILYGIILIIGSYYFYTTSSFFGKNFNNVNECEKFLILTLEESSYSKTDDLLDLKVGYVGNEIGNMEKALQQFNNMIKTELIKYDDYQLLFDALLNNDIKALIIEETRKDLLVEEMENLDISFKTIDTIDITIEKVETVKPKSITEDPFVIYISGSDTRTSKISATGNSDTNIIIVVNPKIKQLLMINIPRDYYIQLNGTTGVKDKLTHAGIYGIEKSMSTIGDLLNINVSYYFKFNFNSVVKIVDAFGGIDVYSEKTFRSCPTVETEFYPCDNNLFYKGYNHLNGRQALEFARARKVFNDGDRMRGKNQQAVIEALLRKAMSPSIITKYNSLLNSISGAFITNFADDEITKLIKMQINDMAKWTITTTQLDGSAGSNYTYTYPNLGKLWVMIPNETTIQNTKTLITKVMNGEKLDSSFSDNIGDIKNPTATSKDEYKPKEEPTKAIEPVIDKTVEVTPDPTVEVIPDPTVETTPDPTIENLPDELLPE